MKALRAHARGGPEQLVYEDAPVPGAPTGADVLVRVAVAAITFDELTWPETWEADGVDRTPIVPSHEFAGMVAAVGPEVTGLAVGDAVFGLVPFNRNGAAAEYVLVPASSIARKPAEVSDATAAAAVLPALTAMEALEQHLQVADGGRLLIRGGTGGVGAFVVQLAGRMGIEVTATVRSAEAAERAKRLGATTALVGTETDRVPAASFDGAIDTVGAGTPEWLYSAVRPGGRVITLQEPPSEDLAAAYGVDAQFFVVTADAAVLGRLAAVLATGELEVAIADTYPLAEGAAAYGSRGTSKAPGKTVLRVRES
ncbi:NADP-dependent oxidoreductase [Planctomonas sp. JC2975]|nr:NADP-dependent oxidoreductase [Planctomonas sp. JC2975]